MRLLLPVLTVLLAATPVHADSVPDVTGLTAQEATTLLKQAGFVVKITRVPDRPADLVFAQEPPGFSSRPAGSTVRIRAGTVKAAAKPTRAPRKPAPTLIGLSASEGRDQMKGWPGAVEEQSLVVPALVGKVVHQWPVGGDPIPNGDHLIVVFGVDERPSDRHQPVPALEGQTLDQARKAAQTAGFSLTVEQVDAPAGTSEQVLAQFPLAGSLAEAGTAIRVRVPRGPAKSDTPASKPSTSLPAPTLVLPAPKDSLRGPKLGFDWQPVQGADRYEVEVERERRDGTWQRAYATIAATHALRDVEMERGRYRWRVRAHKGEATGAWSIIRPFYVFGQ